MKKRKLSQVVAMALPLALLGAVTAGLVAHSSHEPTASHAPIPVVTMPAKFIGVAGGGNVLSYTRSFAKATGVRVSVSELYMGFGTAFPVSTIRRLAEDGQMTLIQLNPWHESLAAIVAGRYDRYLRGYAKAVAAFHQPVALSLGHEMNGWWYPWGYRHASSLMFRQAWRHVWVLFRHSGTRNVIWCWTINRIGTGVAPPVRFWPGGRYVTWVGLNTYYARGEYAFSSAVTPTLRALRFTDKPVVLTETGAAAGHEQAREIRDLFTGAGLAPQIIGIIWFDRPGRHGDWQISGHAPALAAFHSGASTWVNPRKK